MDSEITTTRVCSYKRSGFLDNFVRKLIQSPNRIVGPYIQEGDTVFDMGCGPGFFTLPMLAMVGKKGKVVAVDIQSEMLDIVANKIRNHPLEERVQLHLCGADDFGFTETLKANFVLAYYMVHETPDTNRFYCQVRQHMAPDGQLLVVEPPFHVRKKAFDRSVKFAEASGFKVVDRPKLKGGMSVLLSNSYR